MRGEWAQNSDVQWLSYTYSIEWLPFLSDRREWMESEIWRFLHLWTVHKIKLISKPWVLTTIGFYYLMELWNLLESKTILLNDVERWIENYFQNYFHLKLTDSIVLSVQNACCCKESFEYQNNSFLFCIHQI